MASKHTFKSIKHIEALFAHRSDVAADATEIACSLLRAEAARDFLLHFEHPDVAFCKVVVKGHRQVVHEAQSLSPVLSEATEQVLCLGFLDTPSFRLDFVWRRISTLSCCQQLIKACFKKAQLVGIKAVFANSFRLVYCPLDPGEQRAHLKCPRLSLHIFFMYCPQFSQMMGIAQTVLTLITKVGTVGVVNRDSSELRQNANLIHGLPSSPTMPCIMGQLRS